MDLSHVLSPEAGSLAWANVRRAIYFWSGLWTKNLKITLQCLGWMSLSFWAFSNSLIQLCTCAPALPAAGKVCPSYQQRGSSRAMGQDELLLHVAPTASPGCKQLAISIVKTDTRWEGNRWKVEMACPSSQQVWVRNRSQVSTSTQDLLHNFQTSPDNWFYYKKKKKNLGA